MFSWLKKTFPREQPMQVADVLSAYGALLETQDYAVKDVSLLPVSKTKLKALLKSLYARTSNAELKSHLEVAFMSLSMFQDGVGPTPINGMLLPSGGIENMEADMAILKKWMPWQNLVTAETEILLDEWTRFKAGEPI